MPRMLLDIQNRGQLSAGMSVYRPNQERLMDTYKQLGSVSEVFRLNHKGKSESIMRRFSGRAAIGHVRYATCGKEDVNYAQPFEHLHLQKRKWFTFCFNGQLANYPELRDKILEEDEHHVSLASDTEILMHEIARELSGDKRLPQLQVLKNLASRIDGAYCIAMLNALGEMAIARDPQGIKPMCYAVEGTLFAAASESVALLNLGFQQENIHNLEPGEVVLVNEERVEVQRFAEPTRRAHCFFEWAYFANVASSMDGRSVYLARKSLGEELARYEPLDINPEDEDTVVVPVPDTSKAAADAMAYKLGVPSVEGLIRNRYSGRTFIEGGDARLAKVATKYTPLREVLEGKRIILVEDSIVRSTTMRVLLDRIRDVGRAREIHVRVACPPIIAPCFYGIDMSTVGELFAPSFVSQGESAEATYDAMAKELGADSLRYLPLESISKAINRPAEELCQACLTGEYPTDYGQKLYQIALGSDGNKGRTYEGAGV